MTYNEEEFKYARLAAFVDSEGTIGVYRQYIKNVYYYFQILTVANTDIRLIEWLVDNFGGDMPNSIYTGENHKSVYHWVLRSHNSYNTIKKIRPYLLLKREQAGLAIELWEKVTKWSNRGQNIMPKQTRQLAEDLYQRCKRLNKRGISEDEPQPPKLIRKTITLEEYT